jgi:hypothetical protein
MYDLLYVRRKRRRKIAALVSIFSATGVASLVIISFLGRTVGTFTVSVQNSTVRLALSEKQDFKNPTSYLRIDELPSIYYEWSYDWFDNYELIDNEQNDYYYGSKRENGSVTGMYYLKYTFYVKNVGNTNAQYTLSINVDDCTQSEDGTERTLDETLRIMVFDNDPLANDNHDYLVYAKEIVDSRNKTYDKNGDQTFREFISEYPYAKADGSLYEDEDHPLAEPFLKNAGKTVIRKKVSDFKKNDIRRYTLVYWLEGSDPQANIEDQDAPEGAKIKLSVDITATSYSV